MLITMDKICLFIQMYSEDWKIWKIKNLQISKYDFF